MTSKAKSLPLLIKPENKEKLQVDNPVYFTNNKTIALDEAREAFAKAIEQYLAKKEQDLTEEELRLISTIIEQINTVYLQKRANHFIEERVMEFSNRIQDFVYKAVMPLKNKDVDPVTNFLYYNNKRHVINHE